MQNFKTIRVLRWRILLEIFVPDIEYILFKKTIAANMLSQLPNNGNQENTHKSTYLMETMPKLYNTELADGRFPLYFKLIDHYQWEYPIVMGKPNCIEYKRGFFAQTGII